MFYGLQKGFDIDCSCNSMMLRSIAMSAQLNNYKIPQSKIAGPCMDKPESIRCKTCIMDTSYFFRDLDVNSKLDLQPFLKLKTFSRKEMLYEEGKPCKNLYILLSGEVKVYKAMHNGRHQIYKLVQIPGDLIGCDDLFLNDHSSSAEAITDVNTCYIKINNFLKQLYHNKHVANTTMHYLARNINSYIRHIANLGQKKALERVASYIIYLYETHHKNQLDSTLLQNSLSRIELSEMLGITQRTLIRSLKQLEGNKLITITKTGFLVLDVKGLKELSDN